MSRRSYRAILGGNRFTIPTVTVNGTASPVDLSPLVNDVTYGVRARANYGTLIVPDWGPWSSPPVSVTPTHSSTTYYVSKSGSDGANGRDPGSAWASVARVNATRLLPGDRVYFERGPTSTWEESLVVSDSGTPIDYIIIGAYGTDVANQPQLLGGTSDSALGVRTPITINGSNVLVENLWARRSSFAGVDINGSNVELRWSTISGCPVGVQQDYGAVVTRIHDCVIDNNSVIIVRPGPDDDGAGMGVLLHGDQAEVHHNNITNHFGITVDYGPDGTCVEIYGATNFDVHHNYTTGNVTFSEIGELHSHGGRFHHNLIWEPTRERYVAFNLQGTTWGTPYDMTFEHNTVYLKGGLQDATGTTGFVEGPVTNWAASTAFALGTRIVPQVAAQNNRVYEVVGAGTTGTTAPAWPTTTGATVVSGGVTFICLGQRMTVRNNIFDVTFKTGFTSTAILEDYNLYNGHAFNQVKSIAGGGTTSGTHSILNQAPAYVSTVTPDLTPQVGSPAIDAALPIAGYNVDYAGNPRQVGAAPDIGALEQQTTGVTGAPVTFGYSLAGGVDATQARIMSTGNVQGATYRVVASTDPTLATGQILGTQVTLSAGNAADGYDGTSVLTGLAPKTTYFYRSRMNGVDVGGIQSFKTVGAKGAATSGAILVGACQGWLNWDNDTVYDNARTLASKPIGKGIDYVVHTGDLSYCHTAEGDFTAGNLDLHFSQWRRAYFQGNPNIRGFSTFLKQSHFIFQRDDHDQGVDNSHSGMQQVRDAAQVYRTRFPHHDLQGTAADSNTGFAWSDGRTRHSLPDLRTERTPNTATDNSAKTMMGAAQKQWFKDDLTAFASDVTAGTADLFVFHSTVDWSSPTTAGADNWGGFNTERVELANFITSLGLQNRVLITGGDAHRSGYRNTSIALNGIRYAMSTPFNINGSTSTVGTWTQGPFQNNNAIAGNPRSHIGLILSWVPSGAELAVTLDYIDTMTGARLSGSTAITFTTGSSVG